MKLNKFQKEVERLWGENKENGLVIEAPRQIGKTELILYLANKEPGRVIVVGGFYNQTMLLKNTFIKKYNKDNIKFIPEKEFENEIFDITATYFIDEGNKKLINCLSISTPRHKFVFGREWLEIADNKLLEFRKGLGELFFNQEFETGIWGIDKYSGAREYKNGNKIKHRLSNI